MYDVIGWAGMILFLYNYAAVANGKMIAMGKTFNWLQVVAATASIIYLWSVRAYPTLALNVVFVLIGLCAIFKIRPFFIVVTMFRSVFK